MRTKINNLMIAIAVFIICLIVHTAEVFFIRTDETIFAECFINKVFGICALFYSLGFLVEFVIFVRRKQKMQAVDRKVSLQSA